MKPSLVIGLGNSLMGDDGVGWHVARALAADPRVAETVDALAGGTDLLRYGAEMEGRERVVVVDAMLAGGAPGRVQVFEDCLPADASRRYCHDLSVVEAIQLLRRFQGSRIVLVGVSIESAEAGGLSAAISASLPSIVDRVIEECRHEETHSDCR